jgi:S1-C subfamily serine protease
MTRGVLTLTVWLMSLISLVLGPSAVRADLLESAVVKVFVTANPLDYYRPWQTQGTQSGGGSGFIIEGNKILTNAHVVASHTFVQLKKNRDPRKYTARVEAVGYDCDLALLSVEDKRFFEEVRPLVFGELPKMQDQVLVIGYPQGGDTISMTKGVVSRVEMTAYSQSSRQLLAAQIDAAINPGNSGGPVLLDGKVVGVAMQVLQSSQNIGYMIPMPVINHFLEDLADGRYDGFPVLGIDYQSTENRDLRAYHKMKNPDGGILVKRVLPYSPAQGFLEAEDIILSIDGTPIAEDGTFAFGDEERLSMSYLITQKQAGEPLNIDISRGGEDLSVIVPLADFKPLVALPDFYERPPYYIYGGLVFSVLSSDLMKSWGQRWWEKAPFEFIHYIAGSGRFNSEQRKDIVVLLDVLPDEVNIGYHDFGNDVISRVNEKNIKSFKELVLGLNSASGEHVTLETERGSRIILNVEAVKKANPGILARNKIPRQFSPRVAGWLDKPGK